MFQFSFYRHVSLICHTCRGLCSSIATTFNTPLLVGGPSSVCLPPILSASESRRATESCIPHLSGIPQVVWCWFIGSCMCFTLGASIAEIVSAFPTCGGLYSASALLCPKRHRARVRVILTPSLSIGSSFISGDVMLILFME